MVLLQAFLQRIRLCSSSVYSWRLSNRSSCPQLRQEIKEDLKEFFLSPFLNPGISALIPRPGCTCSSSSIWSKCITNPRPSAAESGRLRRQKLRRVLFLEGIRSNCLRVFLLECTREIGHAIGETQMLKINHTLRMNSGKRTF